MKASWRSFLLHFFLLLLIHIHSFHFPSPKYVRFQKYRLKRSIPFPVMFQSVEDDNLGMDKALESYFAEQIQESFQKSKSQSRRVERAHEDDDDDDYEEKAGKKQKEEKPKTVVEVAVTGLIPNIPIAFAHKNKVMVGNYVGQKPNSTAIEVRTVTGNRVFIDVPQVIEVWEDLSDIVIPTDPASWANVISASLSVFKSLSSKKAYTGNFWQELSNRYYRLPVNSLDLCIYIFQERKFLKWISPVYGQDPIDYQIRQFSSAERYVALTLLFSDYVHFKRRLTEKSFPDEYLQSRLTEDDKQKLKKTYKRVSISSDPETSFQSKYKQVEGILDEETKNTIKRAKTFIKLGGFKVNLRSIALFEKRKLFLEFYDNQLKRKYSTDSNCSRPNLGFDDSFDSLVINNVVNDLEAYSYSSKLTKIPKVIRAILRYLGFQQSPDAAKKLLGNLGNGEINFLKHARYLYTVRKQKAEASNSSVSVINMDDLSTTKIPDEISQEADKFLTHMKNRRKLLEDPETFGKIGKLGKFTKMDYRALSMPVLKREPIIDSRRAQRRALSPPSQETLEALNTPVFHHPICLDDTNTAYFDDAFTLLPDSSEILIHIVDVREALQNFPLLTDLGKNNVMARFFPSGPIPSDPRPVLDVLKLSTEHPNEVITVAIKLDYSTGEIESYRVFPAIIGPVVPISYMHSDRIITNTSLSSGEVCYSKQIINDLQMMASIIKKMMNHDSWISTNLYAKKWLFQHHPLGKVLRLEKKEDNQPKVTPLPPPKVTKFSEYERKIQDENKIARMASLPPLNAKLPPYPYEITPSELIVNTLLTLYSNCSHHYVTKLKQLPVPITADYRDPLDTSIPRRFGTQPLRNYIAQLQQIQIRRALTFEKKGLTVYDCVTAVQSYYEQRQIYQRSAASQVTFKNWQQFEKDYEAFIEDSTQQKPNTRHKRDVFALRAIGLGKGGLVKIFPYEIQAIAREDVALNEKVIVKVVKYHKESMSIWLDVLDRPKQANS